MSWVKITVHQKPKTKLSHIWRTCLLTSGRSSAGGSGADCKLDLTTSGPKLLSTPETLSNWTDHRVSSRPSVSTYFVVFMSSYCIYALQTDCRLFLWCFNVVHSACRKLAVAVPRSSPLGSSLTCINSTKVGCLHKNRMC